MGWKNPHFLFLFLFFSIDRFIGCLSPPLSPPRVTAAPPYFSSSETATYSDFPSSVLCCFVAITRGIHAGEREQGFWSLALFCSHESRFEMCPLRVSFALKGKYFRWKVQWPKVYFVAFYRKAIYGNIVVLLTAIEKNFFCKKPRFLHRPRGRNFFGRIVGLFDKSAQISVDFNIEARKFEGNVSRIFRSVFCWIVPFFYISLLRYYLKMLQPIERQLKKITGTLQLILFGTDEKSATQYLYWTSRLKQTALNYSHSVSRPRRLKNSTDISLHPFNTNICVVLFFLLL